MWTRIDVTWYPLSPETEFLLHVRGHSPAEMKKACFGVPPMFFCSFHTFETYWLQNHRMPNFHPWGTFLICINSRWPQKKKTFVVSRVPDNIFWENLTSISRFIMARNIFQYILFSLATPIICINPRWPPKKTHFCSYLRSQIIFLRNFKLPFSGL